jgi:hypothetical protein
MIPTGPCPHYQPGQSCPHQAECPIAQYIENPPKCDALTANGIQIVREWGV